MKPVKMTVRNPDRSIHGRVPSSGYAPILLLLIGAVLTLTGCDLAAVQGEAPNLVTFDGAAPDGQPLGFAGNTIPMVDSTLQIRVLVADTVSVRSGQGLPAGKGRAQITWHVTSGTVSPDTSEISSSGLATTNWTLGTTVDVQSISATLVGTGVTDASDTFSMGGQSGRQGIYPGPPVAISISPQLLDIREGATGAINVSSMRDKYGNQWNLELFNFLLRSSDSAIASNVDGVESIGKTAVIRGNAGGTAVLTIESRGVLTQDFDFRSLGAVTAVPVTVEEFQGFQAAFSRVSAGDGFACGVASNGTDAENGLVYCWGSTEGGRLGSLGLSVPTLGTPRLEYTVSGLPAGSNVVALASGSRHTCAIVDAATVYCWGTNDQRQLGSFASDPGANRALLDNSNAATVNESGFTGIAAGFDHTCVLAESGSVYCWGANGSGQLGSGEFGRSQILAQRVTGLDGIEVDFLADVGAGATHTCAGTVSGDLYCWGAGGSGQIGDGETLDRAEATRVAGLSSVVAAATGRDPESGASYTCAVDADGDVFCWGDRPGGSGPVVTPRSVRRGNTRYTAVTAGSSHACLLDDDNRASCFGHGRNGRLGTGESGSDLVLSEPQLVAGNEFMSFIIAGSGFTIGLDDDESALTWGDNSAGQLGQATDMQHVATPGRVLFGTGDLQ